MGAAVLDRAAVTTEAAGVFRRNPRRGAGPAASLVRKALLYLSRPGPAKRRHGNLRALTGQANSVTEADPRVDPDPLQRFRETIRGPTRKSPAGRAKRGFA